MKPMLLLALAATLAACGSTTDRPKLAIPSGEPRMLNAGRWGDTVNDIATPPPGAAAATGLYRRARTTP